jgi:hypothetical protein
MDPSKLSPASRRFAERLLTSLPRLAPHAFMEPGRERPDVFELLVEVPSPTGDPARTLVLWMDGGEPSLAFGPWHTHAGLFHEVQGDHDEALLETAAAILSDRFVLCFDVGGAHDGHAGVLDLRDENALAEELTSASSPGTVDLRSWGGTADRRVASSDLR